MSLTLKNKCLLGVLHNSAAADVLQPSAYLTKLTTECHACMQGFLAV